MTERNFILDIRNLSNNYHLLIQLQNLLASHDIVAQRDYQPKLSEIPVEVDEDEETIKIVQLVKSQDALVNIYLAVELVQSRLKKSNNFHEIFNRN